MSTNTLILSGNASYWSSDNLNSGGSLTNLNGLSFTFESVDQLPKQTKCTVQGTATIVITTVPGTIAYNCIIPLSTFGSQTWLIPRLGLGGANVWQDSAGSVALTFADSGGNTIAIGQVIASADSGSLLLRLVAPTSVTKVATSVNVCFSLIYQTN